MTDTTDTTEGTVRKAIRRIHPGTLKLVWLAGLALATLIPAGLISSLIAEREANQQVADEAIARIWGPEQIVSGPTIMIPVTRPDPAPASAEKTTTYARIAPKTTNVEIEMAPERRKRGFFDTTVYAATLHVSGSFAMADATRTRDGSAFTVPDAGFLALTLHDLAGVTNADAVTIGGVKAPWQLYEAPGSDGCRALDKVLVVPATLKGQHGDLPFEATLHLRGTRRLQIAALAKTMNATIKGAWPTPGYIGDEPPARTSVKDGAFSAQWEIDAIGPPGLSLSACAVDIRGPLLGVDLVDATPIYRIVTRATKYAPLFVVLAFTAYFAFELLTGISIALIQYALMAASLSLFALLLVSLGEVTGYTPAYVASAFLVTGQASIFTASVARRKAPALGFAALLAGLFGFLYVLLGLETLALLTGTIALFIVLSILMAATQRVFNRGLQS